jgi:tetratricopeptide (TPR) repeat protein
LSLADLYLPMIESDGARARRELRARVAREPRSIEAWRLLSLAQLRCLNFAASAEASQALLRIAPDDGAALQRLGQCRMALGETKAALAAYERAVAAGQVAAAPICALLLHRLGRLEEAEARYRRGLAQASPESPERLVALSGLARLLRDAGKPQEAEAVSRELIGEFQRRPRRVASVLVDADQSTAFHEWYGLAGKAQLGALLRRAAQIEPGARAPETFALPRDRRALQRFAAGRPRSLYIVKPANGSGGQGISVVDDLTEALGREAVVVQPYLDRPYLIQGRKNHLRVYVLVTSAEPLRAHVYREGVVRFAPEPYDPSPKRLGEVSMHVTNTALHEGHPGLEISQDPSRDDVGLIWSLSALLRQVGADGGDPQAVFGEITDLVGWFMRALRREGMFERQARAAPLRAYGPLLFGFDMLLDEDAHPWLIEIQAKPAGRGSPLVDRINGELFANVFRMTSGPLPEGTIGGADLAAAELAAERAHLGRFVPLDLD